MSAVPTLQVYVRPANALGDSIDKATYEIFKVSSMEQGASKVHQTTVSTVEIPVSSLFINDKPKVLQSSVRLLGAEDDCQFFFKFEGSSAALTVSKGEIGSGAVGLTLGRNDEGTLVFDAQVLTYQEREGFSQIKQEVNESWCVVS